MEPNLQWSSEQQDVEVMELKEMEAQLFGAQETWVIAAVAKEELQFKASTETGRVFRGICPA